MRTVYCIACAVAHDNELLGLYNDTPKYAMFQALRDNLPREDLAAILKAARENVRRNAERTHGGDQ